MPPPRPAPARRLHRGAPPPARGAGRPRFSCPPAGRRRAGVVPGEAPDPVGLGTLRWLWNHPLARRNRRAAFGRFLRWQVGSRLVGGPVAHPFVGATRLLVAPGMRGATGNVYAGLHEFADMGFVLHALRPGDLFVDVGANVGSYTVLAAAAGARVVALEPLPATYAHLTANVRLNGFERRVQAVNAGAGRADAPLRFSADLDAMNHVLPPGAAPDAAVDVPSYRLDGLLGGDRPLIVKVDVEGWEAEVVAGAEETLGGTDPRAVLVELAGLGARYGFDDGAVRRTLAGLGYVPAGYDPFTRRLAAAPAAGANALYVRDLPFFEARVQTAPTYSVQGAPV